MHDEIIHYVQLKKFSLKHLLIPFSMNFSTFVFPEMNMIHLSKWRDQFMKQKLYTLSASVATKQELIALLRGLDTSAVTVRGLSSLSASDGRGIPDAAVWQPDLMDTQAQQGHVVLTRIHGWTPIQATGQVSGSVKGLSRTAFVLWPSAIQFAISEGKLSG